MFAAVAAAVGRGSAAGMRAAAVTELSDARRREAYLGFVAGDYDRYVREMARSGTWGDHVALAALAAALGLRIVVREPSPPFTARTSVFPPRARARARALTTVHVVHHPEVHYDALVPAALHRASTGRSP